MSFSPRQLFLIDGLGALLSAFLLGVILVQFEHIFGMPQKELYFLSSIPCVFVLYDFICYWKIKENWRPFLKAIAIANLTYCCISIGVVFYSYQELTNLGLAYFLIEVIIVIVIAGIELNVAFKEKT